MNYQILNLTIHGNHQGNLVAIENFKEIPFEIKRVYYIWGTSQNATRGKHAHRKLEQLIICISGSCDFLLDDGITKTTLHLDTPNQGLYIKSNVWREFTNFSKDCVIVVLASEIYDENDYIRDYEQFLEGIV